MAWGASGGLTGSVVEGLAGVEGPFVLLEPDLRGRG